MKSKQFDWTSERGLHDLSDISFAPDLIVHFGAGPQFDDGTIYQQLKSSFGEAILLGCSSGGHIGDGLVLDSGATGLALKFDATKLKLVSFPIGASEQSFDVGRSLGNALGSPDLAGIFLLSEGINVNGDDLVEGLCSVIGSQVVIGGGMAADGARFKKTRVTANCLPQANLVGAVGFYGNKIQIQSNFDGGWKRTGSHMKITVSKNNVVYDFDDQTALRVYEGQLGFEAKNLPMSGLRFPIMVSDPMNSQKPVVRTLLGIDRDTECLTFAGNVPMGWDAEIMRADLSDLIEAAEQVASDIMSNALLKPEASILVSCIGRRLVLGGKTDLEVTKMRDILPKNMPMTGFYSYGEFAKSKDKQTTHLLNQTITSFSMSEAA
jgi:hypothetical protein